LLCYPVFAFCSRLMSCILWMKPNDAFHTHSVK
jgi:hypothetical protein